MLKLVKVIDMPVTYIQYYYKKNPGTYLFNKDLLNDRNKYIKKIIEQEADKSNSIYEYFMVDDNNPYDIIGWCRIDESNPEFVFVGNIAYEIEPNKRRQGYGTKILSLALQECKKILKRNIVYVSCNPYNEASKKIILANGGIFDMNFDTLRIGKGIRYKIDLENKSISKKI